MSVRGITHWLAGLIIGVGLIAVVVAMLTGRSAPAAAGFLGRVDVAPLEGAAVWHSGRLKSFGSFAQEMVSDIAGRSGVRVELAVVQEDGETEVALPATVAYLDLLIRPDRYADASIIYVKKKPMRAELAQALKRAGVLDAAGMDRVVETGLVSRPMLTSPAGAATLERWSRDLIRTSKHANAISVAQWLAEPENLADRLAILPPVTGERDQPWLSVGHLWPVDGMPPALVAQIDSLGAERLERLRGWWSGVVNAWRAEDVEGVERNLAGLRAEAIAIAPELYPSQRRLALESVYFDLYSFVWGWIVYLIAVVFLLMSTAFRWDWARRTGLGAFLVAAGLHTFALGLRWYVSGRWPNSNMFEAVTTSVWFGVAIALVLEVLARRTPLRNLFAIGAGVASGAAMMSAQFIDQLDPSINNMMPILHDLWLYIHTNVIIASYALIAMAAATAGLYLLRRLAGGDATYARTGGAGLLMEAAGSAPRPLTMGMVLDGATLVLMELSFILLWAGIVMGAIWADHSWGRPWGWDPKEVFALNTFIVFVVLIHVRLKTRDKGLWTAILAVIGCAVMLFNWIVINFVISGLHSYA